METEILKPVSLILTVGIPGSGKSRFVETCKNIFVVSPDEIRREFSNVSDQSMNAEVMKFAKYMARKALAIGIDVVIDATNVNTQFRQEFVSGLPYDRLVAHLFPCFPDVAYKRIQEDLKNRKDRSDVPEEIIYRMYGEFLYTEKVIEKECFEVIKHADK